MAAKSGSRNSAGGQKRKSSSGSGSRRKSTQYSGQDSAIFHEIGLIIVFALAVILFLCNFGVIGEIGDIISGVMFGLFGLLAYLAPIAIFLAIAFGSINTGNPAATRKIIAGVVLFFLIGIFCEFISGGMDDRIQYNIKELFERCRENKNGGGLIAGSIAFLLYHFLDMVGSVLVVLVLAVICLVIVTERSLVNGVKNSGRRVWELSKEDARRRREHSAVRKQELEEMRRQREEEKRLRAEQKENERILRMDKKVTGVTIDTSISDTAAEKEYQRDDIHEIMLNDLEEIKKESISVRNSAEQLSMQELKLADEDYGYDLQQDEIPEPVTERNPRKRSRRAGQEVNAEGAADIVGEIQKVEKCAPGKYIFPPLFKLSKGAGKSKDSTRELKETAQRLQQTLNTFGVRVTITDISQGPSVTRYELQPEQGVKVSKIVGLSDDIKLNLAATDIRIEAPIPGKAAIGIEVPNKENTAVALRDLLETREFKEFPSKLAFAVGKDIAGQAVVADIAKMPHMLIAGATGSGKSVCINTLIMSILYKAHPDEVKLIMIDPKVVELSVYNGIPHLLIPVVTDPKKAAAALHWGVAEMTDRYKKFAELNVRDLKGYNKKVELEQTMAEDGGQLTQMPQIVIIVDELADLMMVAPGEVEESICRLAQLARAAGIHLIIATQRPSVDVITGLIKANMPSRVAFSVSSGVDSRTILDMNGAEKLLGKGDMLFYPQGYTKPARIQGAFISDKEVSDVVDFLKNQTLGNVYAEDVEQKIRNMGSQQGGNSSLSDDGGTQRDSYFTDAGKFIIDKDKASIGMLQRVFKIGFNRAARIMDQLCDYGVVGEEEGTKPRKVLMSMEEFEQLLEEI